MSIEEAAYTANSYIVKIVILVWTLLCPNDICKALAAVCLICAFLAEQLGYETQSKSRILYWADKVAVFAATLFLAIGVMV